MPKANPSRPIPFARLPRPPRLHPSGVSFDASSKSEPAARFGERPGSTPARRRTSAFTFQRAITSRP